MITIEMLTPKTAKQYKTEITQFYFDNVRSVRFNAHFTWEAAEAKIDGFLRYLENNACVSFGAFESGAVVGFIWAYPYPFREASGMYVNELRVREDYRRRGLGTALLRAVEDRARTLGFAELWLHAECDRPDALRFYEANGYAPERVQLKKEINQ